MLVIIVKLLGYLGSGEMRDPVKDVRMTGSLLEEEEGFIPPGAKHLKGNQLFNAEDKGAERTRARNAIFKSPAHLIHFLNNYMLK
jgi:hypothetical protein